MDTPIKIYKNWKCYPWRGNPWRGSGKHFWQLSAAATVYQKDPERLPGWFLSCDSLGCYRRLTEDNIDVYAALDEAERLLKIDVDIKIKEHQAFADKWNKLLYGGDDASLDPEP